MEIETDHLKRVMIILASREGRKAASRHLLCSCFARFFVVLQLRLYVCACVSVCMCVRACVCVCARVCV